MRRLLLLLVLVSGVVAHHSLPVAEADHGSNHGSSPSGIEIALAAASCVGLVVALVVVRSVRRLLRRLAAGVGGEGSTLPTRSRPPASLQHPPPRGLLTSLCVLRC